MLHIAVMPQSLIVLIVQVSVIELWNITALSGIFLEANKHKISWVLSALYDSFTFSISNIPLLSDAIMTRMHSIDCLNYFCKCKSYHYPGDGSMHNYKVLAKLLLSEALEAFQLRHPTSSACYENDCDWFIDLTKSQENIISHQFAKMSRINGRRGFLVQP